MFFNRFLRKNKFFSCIAEIMVSLISVIRLFYRITGSPGSNIVVLCFHKLGDSVFTIPALKALGDNLNQDFYIFCYDDTKPIYELFFKSENIIAFSHAEIYFGNRLAGKTIRRKLSEINPGEIYDFTGVITSAGLLLFSQAKKVIGISEDYFKPLYTTFISVRKYPHILDVYLDVIRKAFPGKNYDEYKVFPSEVSPGGIILIHPFAGWAAKEWGMSKFIKLAKLINKEYAVAFVVQKGLMINVDIAELEKNNIGIYETGSITELISILKKSSIIISNDSGPAFIANALGKPTLTIYGPTSPLFHHPYGKHHQFIQKKIVCTPVNEKCCYTDAGRSGCKSFECMIQLSVEEVYNKLIKFLSELGIRKKEIVKQND